MSICRSAPRSVVVLVELAMISVFWDSGAVVPGGGADASDSPCSEGESGADTQPDVTEIIAAKAKKLFGLPVFFVGLPSSLRHSYTFRNDTL